MLNKLFKSILEQDTAPIVVCDMDDIIVYMNPSAIRIYHKDLTHIAMTRKTKMCIWSLCVMMTAH